MSFLLSSWSLLAAVIICLLTYIYRKNSRYWISKGVPCGSYVPLIGSLWDPLTLKYSLVDFFMKCYNSTDCGVFGIFIFHKPGLVVRDPEIIKYILVKDFPNFANRYTHPNNKDDPLGIHNLAFIKGNNWVDLRKQLSPGFTPVRLKNLFNSLKKFGEELHEFILNEINNSDTKGVNIDAKELLANYMTETIGSFALGIKGNSIKNPKSELRTHGRKMFQLTWYRNLEWTVIMFIPQIGGLLRCKLMDKGTTDFFRQVTHEVVNDRESSGEIRNDFVDLLVKLKNSPSEDGFYKVEGDVMVAQTAIFFLAGFDTTSTLGAFTLYELAMNQEYQNILREEIQDVFSRNNQELTYDIINEMEYLDMVLAETLRKYPPVPFLERECVKEDGYLLPEPYQNIKVEYGTPIYIPVCGIHMDPKYYPNPHRFDPERFSKANLASRPPYAYLPFGTGPRGCIGERLGLFQVKIGVVNCIRDYKISPCSRTPNPIVCDPKSFLRTPIGGLQLKFEKYLL